MGITYKNEIPYIEEQNLVDLTESIQTPFYVYSQKGIVDTFLEFKKQVLEMSKVGQAEGGRIGYQAGNTVMPGQPMQAQAPGPTDQGPTPEDMGAVSYEELRARLPQEVSDDIVRLLANSAEALEDFAMIQTEQDINTFNKKYGVTLVLPSEG